MVDVHASIDSTNLEALRDPRPWRVVVADYQSAGRGRLAREWRAPAGASIAVSAVVPMPVERAADWGWLPLLTGMAMQQALSQLAQVACRLKWPNDVLVQERRDLPADHGSPTTEFSRSETSGHETPVPEVPPDQVQRDGASPQEASPQEASLGEASRGEASLEERPWLKISGVLCEMVPGGGLVVVGAGANISQERTELPVETATSLALCGAADVRREDVIVAYLRALADLHRTWSGGGAGLAGLRAAYRSSCLTIGLDVDVHQPGGRVARGTATGVDDTGRLVVRSGGSSSAHAAGDVVHVRRSESPAGHTA